MTPNDMTSRERVQLAINHKEPDRVPIAIGGSAQHLAEERYVLLRDYFQLPHPTRRILVGFYTTPDYNSLLDMLGTDIRYVHIRPPAGYVRNSLLSDDKFEEFVDEWGLTHRLRSGNYELAGTPLAGRFTTEGIDNFTWPDPYDPNRVESLHAEVINLFENTNYAIAAHRPVYGNMWEMAKLLLGMEKALVATALEPNLLERLMIKLCEFLDGVYDAFLDVVGPYVQIVEMAEDLGTNHGPMFNPKYYQDVMKPLHKKSIELIKRKAPNAKVLLHCDGAIRDFIPDLIDAGFDILNPIESHLPGMDPHELKAEFGKDMVFNGGVDVKEVLPSGSVEDVRAEVKNIIDQMAPGGGYILGPAHNFSNDIPIENIIAFFEAGHELGRYPIS